MFFSFCLFSESLEVVLPTKQAAPTIYLTKIHDRSQDFDWRYLDELRDVIAFDFDHNGFSSVAMQNATIEEHLEWTDLRGKFDLSPWKKEQIAYVVALQIFQHRVHAWVFDIQKGTAKKYPDFVVQGKLEIDRASLHKIADMIQKDLFGVEGIASLKILYSQKGEEEESAASEIWVCDADGANAKPLIQNDGYCLSPGFLPGKEGAFYYVSFQEGLSKIYVSSTKKKEGSAFIPLRGSQLLPSINRQGTQMAFISDVAGRPDLFIQNLDPQGNPSGKARQLFSAPRSTQASPTFSPDGKQIAFVSDKDGSPRVYVMNILSPKDTKKAQIKLLTKKHRENTSPAWSPDGTKLAFSAKEEGTRQIWIYDFATEQEWQVTSGPENKENPSWAPDSLHLIYNTEAAGRCELFRIHIEHKKPLLISKNSGQKRFACWSSRQIGHDGA